MSFLKLSKYGLFLSATLLIVSAVLLFVPGPKFSIEFTGGTLMSIELPADGTKESLADAVRAFRPEGGELGSFSVSAIRSIGGGSSYSIRMRPLSNEEHVALLQHLEKAFPDIRELQFNTIGPSVSQSLKQRTFVALGLASVAIITYLAFAFRKLPRHLNPWKFGLLAVAAFIHDVIITAGFFVVVGRYTSFEFDTLFVTALLTILAYSTSDTIVIFDRIRANMLLEGRSGGFLDTVLRGLKQSIPRTLGTTISTLIMLVALFLLGAESIRWFILALIFGISIGTYSSYFVASALLLRWK
ncbi:MAG: protein translocase subunit SecF [Candidatus Peribacteraceae bacterium]|nr:protein translocase subunit SecF [Candidatus Peribacteraceae bacterium]